MKLKLIDKILYEEIRPYIWTAIGVIMLILLSVAFEDLAPWPFKVLIDNVLGNENLDPNTFQGHLLLNFTSKESLGFFVILVYGVSSMMVSVTEYFVNVATKKLGRALIYAFSVRAFANLEQIAIGFYNQQQIGDYIYRLSYDVSALGSLLENGFIPLATNTFYLISTIIILFVIDIRLAWISMLILPVLAISLVVFNKQIGISSLRSEKSNSFLFSYIQEALSQLKIIQAFNQERKQARIFNQRQDISLDNENNLYILTFLLDLVIGVVISMGYAFIIMYGIKQVYLKEISTGLLIIFIFYMDNLTHPVMAIMNAASMIREDYVKVSRMTDFFNAQLHVKKIGTDKDFGAVDITFENVSLYGKENLPIIKNVSFKIPAGKKTVIVGVSGSGKTTIAALILRFIDHTSGKILIDGKSIQDYSITALRDIIAYVPQETVLFEDTVRANIAFGGDNPTLKEIKKAANLAIAEGFIERLPRNYDFYVGESGMNLSGGQRQRLMMARGFMRTAAKVVILDEPFASLDVKTRADLMENINKFCVGKTAIIISNILEIIDQADNVIVINEGNIIMTGDKKSLLQERKLVKLILNSA